MIVDTKRNTNWLDMSATVTDDGVEHGNSEDHSSVNDNDVWRSLWGTPGWWRLENRQEDELIVVTAMFVTEFEPRVMGIHFQVKGVKVVDVKIHNNKGVVLTSSVSAALFNLCI